jgi:hypothetical protein
LTNVETDASGRTQPTVQSMVPRFLPVVHTLLPLLALGLGLLAIKSAHVSSIGAYGLIGALPPLYYVALALAGASFFLTWTSPGPRLLRFSFDLLVLVLLLQSPPQIIEPVARFPVAWLTAGFANYVAGTGHVLPGIDARFSWPGFFAGIGMVARAGGLPTTVVVLKWWPVVMNLLYLPPFYLLSRAILGDYRRAMLATWLFPFANWVGQDYFSPQSVAFFLYLVFTWIVVDQFGEKRKRILPRRRRAGSLLSWARTPKGNPPDQAATADLPGPPQITVPLAFALAVLTALGIAMIVSHQITPVFAGLVVTLLALFGRTRLKVFGPMMLLLAAGWLCYAAIAFWIGHFSSIFGGLGNLGGNVTANIGSRYRGSSQHIQILDIRLIVSCFIWGLAGLGMIAGYRQRLEIRTPAILAITPLLVLSGGAYGGEAGLRAYLFSLVGALPLITLLFPVAKSIWSTVAAAAITALLIPGFVLARWGNELSEMTRPSDLAAIDALYRMAPANATLLSMSPEVPWRFTDISRFHYDELDNVTPFLTGDAHALVTKISGNPRGGYVLITAGEVALGEQTYGQPKDWATRLEQHMTSSRRFVLVYSDGGSKIYKFRRPVHG